ncbi:MAG: FtsX-like permease family protein [Tannerellaceae bacterium]|jgi:putative ABC transport system permease protein|nr:FtsX-like permease family protein [Tannerellaceae bacterium]
MNSFYNLKTDYRRLLKNKLYTSITIGGLSVSLMFIIIIAVYTIQEFSTDRFQEKAERIYIIGSEQMPATGAAIAYKLKDRYPEIENVCPSVINNFNVIPVSTVNQKLNAKLMFTDSTFFDFFSFGLIEGNPRDVLIANDKAIVSASFAKKIAGTEGVIGAGIQIGDSIIITVDGVMEDIKNSAIPACDIILPWRLAGKFNETLGEDQLNNSGGTVAFILAHKGSDFQLKAGEIQEWFKTFFWPYERGISKEVRIESLKDFYMSGWGTGYPLNSGNKKFVWIFISIGFLILAFAIINYINLTVAQSGYRFKEIAIRRLLGNDRKEIFFRFIIESVIVTTLSIAVGLLLAFVFRPFATGLLNVPLDYRFLFSPIGIGAIGGIIVIVGCLSGLIPSLVVSSINPIEIIRGNFRRNSKMLFSKVFIIIQFLITVVMLASSFIMRQQISHLLNAPLGFNTANLYEINVMGFSDRTLINTLCNELSSLPSIEKIGITQGVPTSGSNNLNIEYDANGEKRNISFQQYIMDNECFELLGLKILSDNKLTGNGWFLNNEAMRQMNLSEDAPFFAVRNGRVDIAGIVSEFHEKNILGHVSPILFRYLKPEDMGWSVLVKIQGDMYPATRKIADIHKKITGTEIEAAFLDQQIENSFQDQIRLSKIINSFTLIAVIIAFLGLTAMSSYFVQQKTKEIALRKVFGSSNKEVLIHLTRQFLLYILIAFIIASPIAYYIMEHWLSNYSYRIHMSPTSFLFTGLLCMFISFLAVFFQCRKAANKNPVNTIMSD